jgi:RimJ/RimL family protein N-acetyltransferase
VGTGRLLLRPFEESDLAPLAALNGHPRVVETLGSTPTRAQSDGMVERHGAELEREGWGFWAVEVVGAATSTTRGWRWAARSGATPGHTSPVR